MSVELNGPGVASMTVVIPSYQRPGDLDRCLTAIEGQPGSADEILVVSREDDAVTHRVIDKHPVVRRVEVGAPGVAPALGAGIRSARTELIAFLDDDAIPMDGWMSALRESFSDPSVGAAGGPIRNFVGVRTSNSFIPPGYITRVSALGRPHSKLHEVPAERTVTDVDFLPGSNMALRRVLIDVDLLESLPGMAPAMEWLLASQVRRAGYRVRYDSEIEVEHHPAPRPELGREDRVRRAYDLSFATTVITSTGLGGRHRAVAAAFWLLVGSRDAPGLCTAPVALVKGAAARERWLAARHGQIHALRRLAVAHVSAGSAPSATRP